jgi:hypothetical protein
MIYYTRDRDCYALWSDYPMPILKNGLWGWNNREPLMTGDNDFLNPKSSGLKVGEIREVVVKE